MSFARGSDAQQVALGLAAAALSVTCFVWDGLTPGGGYPGRLAIGFAIVSASMFVGVKQNRAVKAAISELSACVDQTIGAAARFGAAAADRRRDDERAQLATVRPFVPRNKGGK